MKKRILIFIDWYLPGFKAGGPIRSVANLVAHLTEHYDFFIVTRDCDYCETAPFLNIKSDEWNALASGEQVFYISNKNLTPSAIKKIIKETSFDFIYLNSAFSFYFTILPLFYLRKKKVKIIVATRGMFAKSALDIKRNKKRIFIKIAEWLNLFENVVFHASTEIEKEDILNVLGENTRIKLAGNLPEKKAVTYVEKLKTKGSARLVNVARIAPEKNLLGALELLSGVKGEIIFDFYGPVYNAEYWEKCKEVLRKLPENIKANYKESIENENVAELLHQYHFMFMPTMGENFGHIILQALASSCPVIISDKTPWMQLKEKNAGWDIPLSEPDRFRATIDLCVSMDQGSYSQMSRTAFEYGAKYIKDPELIEQNRLLFVTK